MRHGSYFFQQSYVIDKRIGARFIKYERVDLIIGIVLVTVGAVAMIAFCAEAFKGTAEYGHFTDAGAVASGVSRQHGFSLPGILFAIALIDASIIGAVAYALRAKRRRPTDPDQLEGARMAWRMPELGAIGPLQLTPMRRTCMIVLRGYLAVAVVMVVIRVIQSAAS